MVPRGRIVLVTDILETLRPGGTVSPLPRIVLVKGSLEAISQCQSLLGKNQLVGGLGPLSVIEATELEQQIVEPHMDDNASGKAVE